MKKFVIILMCLFLSGCGEEVIELTHPSRDLSNIPLIDKFDAMTAFSGNMRWVADGVVLEGIGGFYSDSFLDAYVPPNPPEFMGNFFYCPVDEKWILASYENCPICGRKMKRWNDYIRYYKKRTGWKAFINGESEYYGSVRVWRNEDGKIIIRDEFLEKSW